MHLIIFFKALFKAVYVHTIVINAKISINGIRKVFAYWLVKDRQNVHIDLALALVYFLNVFTSYIGEESNEISNQQRYVGFI